MFYIFIHGYEIMRPFHFELLFHSLCKKATARDLSLNKCIHPDNILLPPASFFLTAARCSVMVNVKLELFLTILSNSFE